MQVQEESKTKAQEGYTKFSETIILKEPVIFEGFNDLNRWRDILYALDFIGVYPNGVGFGNVSKRDGNSNQFFITGGETGKLEQLCLKHYPKILDFDYVKNHVTREGIWRASSESMTHASVYECDPEIRAVFHIHNLMMWERLKGKMPTTAENVEFGTPEMAYEIKRLFTDSETYVKERKIIVMGGHKEGIISFGTTMDEAGMMLLRAYTGKQRR